MMASGAMEGRVECRNVTKMFGEEWARQVVVKGCSFVVEAGQLNVLIGPSGCGKTTLINLIAGYEEPGSGEILIDGQPVQGPGRCELARALINQPKIMLMDEPFRGLDAMTRELMQEYLLRLFEETRHTILFVTSELEEAIFLADRLLVLSAKPTAVKEVLDVDLPRPRDFRVLTSHRYALLKQHALEALYQEAVKAFAKGSKAAYDLVEAFGKRVGGGG